MFARVDPGLSPQKKGENLVANNKMFSAAQLLKLEVIDWKKTPQLTICFARMFDETLQIFLRGRKRV